MKILSVFILILLILPMANARVLPSTLDDKSFSDAINSTGTYCYDAATARDAEIKVYIEKELNSLSDEVKLNLKLFKFLNTITVFLAVFLAIFINNMLKNRRLRKLDDLNNSSLGFQIKEEEKTKKNHGIRK